MCVADVRESTISIAAAMQMATLGSTHGPSITFARFRPRLCPSELLTMPSMVAFHPDTAQVKQNATVRPEMSTYLRLPIRLSPLYFARSVDRIAETETATDVGWVGMVGRIRDEVTVDVRLEDGMALDDRQRKVAWVGVVAMVVMLLFPPWVGMRQSANGPYSLGRAGYAPVWSPPKPAKFAAIWMEVDSGSLVIQVIALGVAVSAGAAAVRRPTTVGASSCGCGPESPAESVTQLRERSALRS